MVGDVRRQMGLVEPFGDWMGTGGGHSGDAAAFGPRSYHGLRNKILGCHVGDARREGSARRPTPISMPVASVAGRALRVPSGSACGRPFPRPAAAGPGGLWEARGEWTADVWQWVALWGSEAHSQATV